MTQLPHRPDLLPRADGDLRVLPGGRFRPQAARGLAVALTAALTVAAPLAAASPASADPALPRISAAPPQNGGCVKPSRQHPADVPWPQQYIAPSRAWDTTRGAGATVAVVDTGVDAVHSPALAGRVTPASAAAGTDCIGHGTFVAGLIAAAPRPGTGFAGVAPEARIIAVRATASDGTATANSVAAGIDAAVARRARVIDVPIALDRSSPALAAAVRDAGRHGALVIAPAYGAGSTVSLSGDAPAPAAYPAALPDVLAVAALGPGGVPDQKSAPRTAPDVAAPGNAVMSVGPGGTGSFTGDGAELATAFVAGAAALAVAAHPDLTPSQLADRLAATAYHIPADRALVGAGTVDPAAAVTAPVPGATAHAASRAPADLRMPPPEAHSGRTTAVAVTTAAGAAVLVTGFIAFTLPRARRRGWRPGGSTP
ncbi:MULTISPECIES: S8 family serine peptidase [unclassified Streptomyces]|uniref:S8 family serine peptidase n=1 Tax=unclassified Streptomyces TaxID=2593676 RepID=UPI002E75A683|nr:S8 family serine peptidase [Streptomyces sp. JV184]MEE1746123.1 S8 family serine peptidase [Streptomyces sp. JV184]